MSELTTPVSPFFPNIVDSSAKKMGLIIRFLRFIFRYNCPCFEKNCDIKLINPDPASSSTIKQLMDYFKSNRNEQSCVTIFNSEEHNHCSLIEQHFAVMQRIGLIQIRSKTLSSESPIVGLYSILPDEMKAKASQPSLASSNGSSQNKNPNGCSSQLNAEPIGACRLSVLSQIQPGKVINCVTFHNGKPLSWETIKETHVQQNCFCLPLQDIRAQLEKITKSSISDDALHLFAQILYWYFRKGVVDNLIQQVALEKGMSKNCVAMSVGSTKITSDYDITVQGECVEDILKSFNNHFYLLFGETSDIVFDTNLYGTSFALAFKPKQLKFYVEIDCSEHTYDKQWYYVVKAPSKEEHAQTIVEQRAWALLKLYIAIMRRKEILEKKNNTSEYRRKKLEILNTLIEFFDMQPSDMQNVMNLPTAKSSQSAYLQGVAGKKRSTEVPQYFTMQRSASSGNVAQPPTNGLRRGLSQQFGLSELQVGMPLSLYKTSSISNLLETSTENLTSIFVNQINYAELPFEAVYNQKTYKDLLNMISLYNFYGNETYLTRGAFLDVVFSQQTCSGIGRGGSDINDIGITMDDYLNSFLENLADYIAHEFKDKYRERLHSAFVKYLQLSHIVYAPYQALVQLTSSDPGMDQDINRVTFLDVVQKVVSRINRDLLQEGYSLPEHLNNMSNMIAEMKIGTPSP